jgi:hypothetical protein
MSSGSFNFESCGIPIAKLIKNGAKPSKRDAVISLDEHSSARNNYPELMISGDERFQYIPDDTKERTIHYIVGASGSGKSYFAAQVANEYKKLHPKNPVYLLSYVDSDSSIEQVKGIKRIPLNDEFLQEDLNAEDFENALTIWDDTDCITDKKMKLKLKDLLGKLLNTGRHTGTSVIYLSHIACGGLETKPILNECHSLTFFNATLGGRAKSYLLNNYMGLNRKEIMAIDNIAGRAITILKSFPMVLIAEKEITLVKNLGKK